MVKDIVPDNLQFPSLIDLQYTLDQIREKVVDVRWGNSKTEFALLNKFCQRQFRLHVENPIARDKLSLSLGLDNKFDEPTLNSAFTALNSRKTYNWRGFCDEHSPLFVRNLLFKLAADCLRAQKAPTIVNIACAYLPVPSINVTDVDILMRLKTKK